MASNLAETEKIESHAKRIQGPLVPLSPPKHDHNAPTLNSPTSRANPFENHPDWLVETFVVPAAYPRSIPGSTKSPTARTRGGNESEQEQERIDLEGALIDLYVAQVQANLNPVEVGEGREVEQEQLFLAVNRYSRKNLSEHEGRELARRGVTLVLAHANGFHKEIWEPMLDDLLTVQDPSIPIFELWALDCVCQGDSGAINEAKLGNTFSWPDNGRDVLQFLISYLPSPLSPSYFAPSNSPSVLTPQPPSPLLALDTISTSPGSPLPSARKFRDRHLVGVGHSLGGAAQVFASTALPSLFSSLVLVDPVLVPPPPVMQDRYTTRMTAAALVRREKWRNRAEAEEGFLKKAFFRAWDSRVLERYVSFGIKDVAAERGGVALKTRAKDEALVFADPLSYSSHRACIRLNALTPLLPIHFILPSANSSVLPESAIDWLLGEGAPHASHVRIEDSHHLLVQEKPRRTAEEIAKFLKETYGPDSRGAKL